MVTAIPRARPRCGRRPVRSAGLAARSRRGSQRRRVRVGRPSVERTRSAALSCSWRGVVLGQRSALDSPAARSRAAWRLAADHRGLPLTYARVRLRIVRRHGRSSDGNEEGPVLERRRGSHGGDRFAFVLISLALDEVDATDVRSAFPRKRRRRPRQSRRHRGDSGLGRPDARFVAVAIVRIRPA
jgi:hypothetical protein